MSGLFWKLPLVVLVALLIAATTLASRARSTHGAPPLPAALRPPTDGLHLAKRAAASAVETDAVRRAVRNFHRAEGRAPAALAELDEGRYFDAGTTRPDLRRFRYDPGTMHVSRASR